MPAPLAQRPTVDPRAAALPPAGQTAQVQPRPPAGPSPAPTPPNPLFPPVAPAEQQVAHQTLMPPIGPAGPPAEMPAIGPAPSPPLSIGDDPRLVEARQMLAQARAGLQNKDYVKAWNLANQVDRMGLVLPSGEDTPSAVLRDIQAARQQAATPQQPALPLPELARQQARQVMADARRLQREGKLIEARARVLEAQKIGAHLGPDDDLPERALLELASLCDKKIDNLQQEALDNAQTGHQDPARFQKAEANLLQARHLASVFGLDLEPIDKNLAKVKQLQAQLATAPPLAAAQAQPPAASAQPPAVAQTVLPAGAIPPHLQGGVDGSPIVAPPQPRPEATPQQRGLAMLQQARLNLRNGDTVTARRLAEEVFAGDYGMRPEAEMVLRQIDTEEFNQRVHLADRSFDAALEAYRRRDFRTCRTILDQIDPRMLRPEKQARLRELAQTAEMQPAALGLAGADRPTAGSPAPNTAAPQLQPVVDLQPASPASPADDYARQIAAMQEVAFQQLRDAGIEARNRATELFSAGETDRALDLLRDYLSQLDDQPLDRDKLALLKKPIDHRLQQLKTLKAQKDLEAVQKSATATFHENRYREHVAQEEKNTQVGDLIKQFNELFKQGKYREAELAALKARELDPDNPTADAAIYMVRTQRNLLASRQARDNNREMLVGALNDAENSGPYAGDKNPLVFDLERYNIAKKRDAIGKGIFHHLKSDKEREIERRLDLPITLSFKDMPLRQVIDDLREEMGLNIIPDTKALEEEGISLERPVTLKVESISRKSALNILLRMVHLTYIIKDEVLQITTEKHARGKLVQKSYPVADLVIPIDNYAIPTVANMTQQLSPGDNRNLSLNGATPFMAPPPAVPPPGSDSTGSMADDAAARDYPPNAPAANPLAGNRAPGQTHTVQDMLIKLITNTIEPHSWSDVGGPGTIDYFPIGMALIINQTPDVQEQVAELLDALRRLQDLEVSVEVRMISLEETFYERIGLDFNLNIKTDHYTLPWENQIVTQQFKPPGLINDFSPAGRFVAGLTPAGFPGPNGNQAPFTSDLDIPIRNSSFGMAVPPFGGFPNIPGANGGLSMGLAFLSDIQVFLFMEAAQGDRRTHILQAPKLTLFNGQTSTIQIQDFQFFTTQVQVIQVGGQVVFLPQNQPIPLGINLAIQAVVSADRRFVRLNLAPTMTNLASATVPLFPITTFITPVFEGGAQGQPIPFTQFIQQPTFTFVNIQTTVSVPDGGTVLIGGLKLMNEGRNEFGTPILSKVPWLNRLFKNVGYGRDTSSLLFLVTPRIIINYEEEERQTGVVTLPPAGQ
jgi:type II secretory pathway component GspD/PulD (secretin)